MNDKHKSRGMTDFFFIFLLIFVGLDFIKFTTTMTIFTDGVNICRV